MNITNLINTLKFIPDDSRKKVALSSITPHINEIKWTDLVDIIGCYSTDPNKIDAITIFISIVYRRLSVENVWNTNYIPLILQQFSADSGKLAALKILDPFIFYYDQQSLANVINAFSSDCAKLEAISLAITATDILSNQITATVVPLLSMNESKTKALQLINSC